MTDDLGNTLQKRRPRAGGRNPGSGSNEIYGAPYVQAARQEMAQNRAQRASGGGRRAPAVAPSAPPRGDILLGPPAGGASAAALNRPREEWGAPAAGGTTAQGGKGPFRPIEAGSIGDPRLAGSKRVVITGPNEFRVISRDPYYHPQTGQFLGYTEGSITHRGNPHEQLAAHQNFYPNPDYAAMFAPSKAEMEKGLTPELPDRGRIAQSPSGPVLERGGVATPVENLSAGERVARGVGGAYDTLTASPAANVAGRVLGAGADRIAGLFRGGGAAAGTAYGGNVSTGQAPAQIPKPAGIDALVPPPEMPVARGGGMPMRGAS